ncbi:MAG TPA: metallophosphoesterase [Acidimicrobiales bacterium]|nr:metallophosphoesterase [Acidimicrobiales bacterium]
MAALLAAGLLTLATAACSPSDGGSAGGGNGSDGGGGGPPGDTTATTEPPAPTTTAPPPPVLVAAGDIACVPGMAPTPQQCQMEATAQLVESLGPTVVAPLGDLQYDRGEAENFAGSYGPTWGRFKAVTRPAPGNHEYAGGRAPGYYGFFEGAADGADGRGWYSYDVGAWHVVALNSVCAPAGGCGEGSPQLAWLRADLAATPARCILAYWHHPRYSSGLHGGSEAVEPFWQALAAAGADVVLSGHDHHYERLAPIGGIRQFVVGTGGRNLYPVLGRLPESEIRDSVTFGVLALTLRPDGYDWRFLPVPGRSFTDAGSASC